MKATTHWYNPITWDWNIVSEIVREYADTFTVLLFIGTQLATFLIMFQKIEADQMLRHIVGGLSLAFTICLIGWAVHKAIRK